MNLNKIKNISIFMIIVLCFITHFVYDLFPSFFTSLFFPVNESVWEHMKMLFSSIVIWNFILYFIFKTNGYFFNNFFLGVLCSCVCCILLFLIMYYPMYFMFGDCFFTNVILLSISIFLSVNIEFSIFNNHKFNLDFISFMCIIIIFIIFGLFTYFPPKISIFVDPRYESSEIIFD